MPRRGVRRRRRRARGAHVRGRRARESRHSRRASCSTVPGCARSRPAARRATSAATTRSPIRCTRVSRRARPRRARRADRHRRRRVRGPARGPAAAPGAVRRRAGRVGGVLRAVAGRRCSTTPSSASLLVRLGLPRWATSPRSRPTRCWRASGRRAGVSTTSRAGSMRGRRCSSRHRPISSSRWSSTRPRRASTPPRSRRRGSPTGCSSRLAERGLACTRVVIEAETEHGERLARCWRHDRVRSPRLHSPSACAGNSTAGWWKRRAPAGATPLRSTPRPAGSRSCGSFPTRSCPPTAASSGSGAAIRPRTTAPTARSRACRACSATTRSRPRSCKAGAPPPSRCAGCRGASRASRSARWWSAPISAAWPGALPSPFPARVFDPPAPGRAASTSTGPRSWCRGGVSSRRAPARVRVRDAAGRGRRRVAAGPARGPPTCGGGTRRAPSVRALAGGRRLRRRRGQRRVRGDRRSRPGRRRSVYD